MHMAAQQAAAKEAKEAAQARATEKRDAEAAAEGQGVLDFGPKEADAATAPKAADEPEQQAFDLSESAQPPAATESSEAPGPVAQDVPPPLPAPAGPEAKPNRPAAALAEGPGLQEKVTKYRRHLAKQKHPAKVGQATLPLPEGTGIAPGVSVNQAVVANLHIDTIRSQVSKNSANAA